MRKIHKIHPPISFTDFLRQSNPSRWEEIHKTGITAELREFMLIKEQDCRCGYTEIVLNDEKEAHIDHFRKRDLFPQYTFDWNNLIAALHSDKFGADFKDNHYRITREEYNLIFNPTADPIESYFEYTALGEIIPKADLEMTLRKKAEKTIEIFNLNDHSLIERRKDLYRILESYQDLDIEIIRKCLSNSDFISMIEQWLDKRK